jgi:hypothetical protein
MPKSPDDLRRRDMAIYSDSRPGRPLRSEVMARLSPGFLAWLRVRSKTCQARWGLPNYYLPIVSPADIKIKKYTRYDIARLSCGDQKL